MATSRTGPAWLSAPLEQVGDFVFFVGEVLWSLFRPPLRPGLMLQQMDFIGVGSLFIILLTGAFSGAVFTLQSVYAFSLFNMENLVGSTVTLALTREVSPVLASLMITGRAGSAMATELGTMRVTEQIDALKSMAVNPIQYLVVPRVLAALVMFPVMTMIFNLVGVVGSYVVGVELYGIDPGAFVEKIRILVQPHDITSGLVKAAAFGVLVTLVACYKGYQAEGGARGVGAATTRAVVLGSVGIMVMDYFLTLAMF